MSSAPEATIHEPWDERDRQHEAMLFGLWIFLATEVLFFGGLFLLYAYARHLDWAGFSAGARRANPWFGTANTVVLLTSSLTMAVAERSIRAGWERLGRWGLWLTVALGLTFLVVKGFEYREDLSEALFPGAGFRFTQSGAIQFWDFYWVVTIVHAIHLTIGLGLVLRLILLDRWNMLGRRWDGGGGDDGLLAPRRYGLGGALPAHLPGRTRPVTDETRHILLIPFLVWLGLLALLMGSLGYAYLPDAPLKLGMGLAIAAPRLR